MSTTLRVQIRLIHAIIGLNYSHEMKKTPLRKVEQLLKNVYWDPLSEARNPLTP